MSQENFVKHTDLDDDYPTSDNGINFFFHVIAFPVRAFAFPVRILIGIVSAQRIDDDCAKRGLLDGEYNPEMVEEVLNEYGERFNRRGRGN